MNTENTKWTPGPWMYRQDEGGRPAMHSDWQVYAAGSTHDRIAPVARLELRGHQAAHNARLIAAAPEMAEALAAIVARINGEWDNPALLKWGALHPNAERDIEANARAILARLHGEGGGV